MGSQRCQRPRVSVLVRRNTWCRVCLASMLVPAATAGEVPMGEQPLTIGIEEEFQIVDAGGKLKAHIETLLAAARSSSLVDDVRAEMLQSVVEVGTRICADVGEAPGGGVAVARGPGWPAQPGGAADRLGWHPPVLSLAGSAGRRDGALQAVGGPDAGPGPAASCMALTVSACEHKTPNLILGVPALLISLIIGAIRVQSQSRRLNSRYRPPDNTTSNTTEATNPECWAKPG
jgi:hypothetical protein